MVHLSCGNGIILLYKLPCFVFCLVFFARVHFVTGPWPVNFPRKQTRTKLLRCLLAR